MTSPKSGPPDLIGSTAVVTGAAGGIGTAICHVLAREGADIVATDLDGTDVSDTVDLVESAGRSCTVVRADVTDPDDGRTLRESALESHGSVDVLVNAAGVIGPPRELADVSLADWNRIVGVNLTGTFLVSQALYDPLADASGKIVCLASVAGKVGGVLSGPDYVSSKAGVIGLVKWLAKTGAEDGIFVNGICPGPTDTSLIADLPGLDEIPARAPLGRLGEPEDIAEGVLFLASQQSNWITGEILDINGGLHMD